MVFNSGNAQESLYFILFLLQGSCDVMYIAPWFSFRFLQGTTFPFGPVKSFLLSLYLLSLQKEGVSLQKKT